MARHISRVSDYVRVDCVTICVYAGIDSDDDDDDDDECKDYKFVDCIGRIEHRLKANKLHYAHDVLKGLTKKDLDYHAIKRKLITMLKQLKQKRGGDKEEYMHRKRLVLVVDGRTKNKHIWFVGATP